MSLGQSGLAAAQMKKAQVDEGTEDEEEACCVSIVCNLLLGLQRGSRRDRVAAKFVENEFEKCDRLLEIFTRRSARVAAAEVCCSLAFVPRAGRHACLRCLQTLLLSCNSRAEQGRCAPFLNSRQQAPAACRHRALTCGGCTGAHRRPRR